MKKIQLSVPKPCHENWDAMRPEEQGRFCGSCQKTVVDFTTMSDRQIAEFFKKPAGSTCGRFHNDQLNREIAIPRKRIPWVKYLFTVSIPAFMASCKFAGRQAALGELQATEAVKTQLTGDTTVVDVPPPPSVVGMILMPGMAKESLPVAEKPVLLKREAVGGNIEVVQIGSTKCEAETLPPNTDEDSLIKEGLPLDTVNIVGYGNCSKGTIMGGLVATRIDAGKDETVPLTETPEQTIDALAYPNPVRAGSRLTVVVASSGDEPKQVQLFSSNGALISLSQKASFIGKNLTLTVPSSITAGTYFVRIVSENKKPATVKIIVLK